MAMGALVPCLSQAIPAVNPAERMYLEGVLPSGEPMRANRQGTPQAPGTAFSCAGCHLRAGLGQWDGSILIPPINAANLFKPSYRYNPNLGEEERKDLPPQMRDTLRRPAYTELSLKAAIREGVDPAGRPLSEVMPCYQLDDHEADLLVGYLKELSRDFSPGADDTTLRFATVVTEGVSRQDRSAFLTTLEHQVRIHNNLWPNYHGGSYRTLAMRETALAFRKWSLAVWELRGAAGTWRDQLEGLARQGPVFALLGGISYGDWLPVHEFAESHGIPCILPITDFPVTSGAGGRTLYFSGGFHLEGEAAAAHLAGDSRGKPVLMIHQDSHEGRALAAGFREAWKERGRPAVREVPPLPAGPLNRAFLAHLLRQHRNATLVLWTGPESFPALAACASGPGLPAKVIMSATYLRDEVWNLPQNARRSLLLTYPYRLEQPVSAMGGPKPKAPVSLVTVDNDRRVRTRAFTVMQVVNEGVRRMGRDFYRDHFLDGIGLMEDKTDSDYPLLIFNPGQRFLAAGCYLVRLPQGPLHGFVRETGWAIL